MRIGKNTVIGEDATIKEAREEIVKKYDKNHLYFDALNLIEKRLTEIKKDG